MREITASSMSCTPSPVFALAVQRILGVYADDVLDFLDDALRFGCGQINLVQHRHDLHPLLDGGIAIGDGLGLHALRRIHHQERAFAGGQRARYFIGKIDVAGRIDQVQQIGIAVARLILQRGRLGLDGNAALALEVHGIEYLRLHLAVRQAAAHLDDAVRQGGFAVVDVGNDGKITDVLHQGLGKDEYKAGWRIRKRRNN